jgi:hypothetical protein
MDYAVWNPVPWCFFLAGILLCVMSVTLFHKRFPNYPWGTSRTDVQAKDIMVPISEFNGGIGNLPNWRIPINSSIVLAQQILATGVSFIGVEDAEGNLVGIISTEEIPQ